MLHIDKQLCLLQYREEKLPWRVKLREGMLENI